MLSYNPIINTIHYKGYDIAVLRLDLIHPEISGNKWFKLKYNLQEAKLQGKNTIITFGGAYSNHIAATAFACREEGLRCIGIIRGEENALTNPTLSLAKQHGMTFRFISREQYKQKTTTEFLTDLYREFPDSYIIPEGGDNELGEKGCSEIITPSLKEYTDIYCAYGTGTTFRGIAKALEKYQTATAVNVLKYEATSDQQNTFILNDYHFGGYAKHTVQLLGFKTEFEKKFKIELDYIYTCKLFFAVFDQIDQNKLHENNKILIIHSGGLQGNKGYEERYNLNPSRQVIDPHG